MLIEAKSVPMSIVDPWTLYLYAMRSPATKEKYLMRLGKFLNFLNLQGTKKKAEQLINSCKSYGLFIVHKGELEAWMKLPIGKKNKGKWVVRAVDALREGCPQDLASFLEEIFTYLRKPNLRKQEELL